jgi:hypothetical protein
MIMRLSAFILWGFVLCAAFLEAAAQESTGNLNMAPNRYCSGQLLQFGVKPATGFSVL